MIEIIYWLTVFLFVILGVILLWGFADIFKRSDAIERKQRRDK